MQALGRSIAVIGLIVIVSGCTEKGVRFLEPGPAFPPPGESKKITTFGSQNPSPESSDTRILPAAIDDFIEAAVDARVTSEYSFPGTMIGSKDERIKTFVERGINLSNQLCIVWFEALRIEQKKIDHQQGLFVTAASGLTTVFGILNLSTDILTGMAAGTTAGNALFDNYRAAFLFSPDLYLIKDKVNELQKQSVTQLNQTNFESYDDARNALLSHDAICSGQTVEKIINDSARVSEFEFDPPGGPSTKDVLEAGKIAKEIADLIELPGVKDLTITQVKQLYIVYLGGLDDDTAEELAGSDNPQSLIAGIYGWIETNRLIDDEDANKFKMIISALQRVAVLLDLEAEARKTRQQLQRAANLQGQADLQQQENNFVRNAGDTPTAENLQQEGALIEKIESQVNLIFQTFGRIDIERRAPGYSFGYRVVPGSKYR